MRELTRGSIDVIAASLKRSFYCYGSYPAYTAWKGMHAWYQNGSSKNGAEVQDLPHNDIDVYIGTPGDGVGGVLRSGCEYKDMAGIDKESKSTSSPAPT
jgi:hypothetical protein